MKLNDIPEDDTHTHPCAHPMLMTPPHMHTTHCLENDSLGFIRDKVLSFLNMNIYYI